MSMAEFGFCNMTYGAQSARHEWRESQARKPERKEETAAEKAAAERAREDLHMTFAYKSSGCADSG